MKIAVAILFFAGLFGLSIAQESPPTHRAVPPPVGVEIGQPAPAFTLSDQFGHAQSNETLKGSKGTVLLFFRSADW
jgi:cytochrome oxidase Cu insertion factor (SCO1/SenC/PrrC family)